MPEEVSQRCPKCGQRKTEPEWYPSCWGKIGRWCRQCHHGLRYMQGYQRGELRYPFKVAYWRQCDGPECGSWFQSQKERGRFCSRRCKNAAQHADIGATLKAEKAKITRHCPHCGDKLAVTKRADAAFCSVRCEQAAHNATKKASRKRGERAEHVSRAYIYNRDGGRCHICGTKRPPNDFHLDHLIPLADGGQHAPENLAVACPSCNTARGRRGAAQLLLLG